MNSEQSPVSSLQSPVSYAHPTPFTMHLPLVVLALGAVLSWLVAGEMAQWLAESLPFHEVHVLPTLELVAEITLNEATLLALLVVAAGMAVWWWRGRVPHLWRRLYLIRRAASHDFGFEWLNHRLVDGVEGFAAAWQTSQTGQLNWNIAGIVAGLIIVLMVLLLA